MDPCDDSHDWWLGRDYGCVRSYSSLSELGAAVFASVFVSRRLAEDYE